MPYEKSTFFCHPLRRRKGKLERHNSKKNPTGLSLPRTRFCRCGVTGCLDSLQKDVLISRHGHACSALLLLLLLLLLFQGLRKRTEEYDQREIQNICRNYHHTVQTACFTATDSCVLTTSKVQNDF